MFNNQKGWDNYVSKEKIKVRKTIFTEERLFSLSSVTSPASRREELKASKASGVPSKNTNKNRKSKSGGKVTKEQIGVVESSSSSSQGNENEVDNSTAANSGS